MLHIRSPSISRHKPISEVLGIMFFVDALSLRKYNLKFDSFAWCNNNASRSESSPMMVTVDLDANEMPVFTITKSASPSQIIG